MSNPLLSYFDRIFLRPDATEAFEPWASAPVEFYRQGATVFADKSIDPGKEGIVQVCDVGELGLAAGLDLVRVGTDGPQLQVLSVDPSATELPARFPGPVDIKLKNNTPNVVDLYAGDRLIVTTDRPSVYPNSDGTGDPTSSLQGRCIRTSPRLRALAAVRLRRRSGWRPLPATPCRRRGRHAAFAAMAQLAALSGPPSSHR